MDNNFNPKIGDYVETLNGTVGYIFSINTNRIEVCFSENKHDKWNYTNDYDCLKDSFKQIGTYKFNEKISELENFNDSFELSKMVCKNGNDEDYESIDLKVIISKINEIIDYLNKE